MRHASYIRVSTVASAEHDVSIPAQRRAIENSSVAVGHEHVQEFVEPGVSAKDDNRPAFQVLINAALSKKHLFDAAIVYDYNRFFAV